MSGGKCAWKAELTYGEAQRLDQHLGRARHRHGARLLAEVVRLRGTVRVGGQDPLFVAGARHMMTGGGEA